MKEPELMLSVEEALERLLAASGDPLEAEDVSLDNALDRVLAASIQSALDLPPWDNSSMDGFAVHAADVAGATPGSPVRLRVVGEVRAGGSAAVDVPLGCTVRITTGARMPDSADAVVPVESTVVEAGPAGPASRASATGSPREMGFLAGEPLPDACLVRAAVEPGDFVRTRGQDVHAGTRLLEPSRLVTPAQISLAAAVGVDSLRVHRRPVVAVLSTGDELRTPGQLLGPAGIPDANRPGLLAMCREEGASVLDLGIVPDSLDATRAALERALEQSDVLIVSGGVSVGPYDLVRSAFEAIGQVDLWRVAVQPGKPFALGRTWPRRSDGRRVLMFGLPGNPVSALVTFHLFVRPVLGRLAGLEWRPGDADRAITEDRLEKAPARRGFLRVAVLRDESGAPARDAAGRLRVRLSGGQGSHVLSAMALADALAVVPETVDRLEPGSEVEIRWLRR